MPRQFKHFHFISCGHCLVQTSRSYPSSILGTVLDIISLMFKHGRGLLYQKILPSSLVFCSCHQFHLPTPAPTDSFKTHPSCDPWFLLMHNNQVLQCLWCVRFLLLEKELCFSAQTMLGPTLFLLSGDNKRRQGNLEAQRQHGRVCSPLQGEGLQRNVLLRPISPNIPKPNLRSYPFFLTLTLTCEIC